MDSDGVHSNTGDTVILSNVYCKGCHFYIQVETTAPPTSGTSGGGGASGGGASGGGGNGCTRYPPSSPATSAHEAMKRKSKKRRSFRLLCSLAAEFTSKLLLAYLLYSVLAPFY